MFDGIHDLASRDVARDWSLTTVKTEHFDPSAQPVVSMQNPWELAQLVEIYRRACPETVLELGPYHGGTLYHWIKNAVSGARIAAVDFFDELIGPRQATPEDWQKWIVNDVEFKFFYGDTRDPEIINAVRNYLGSIDWLFIDATHDYEYVRQDFENYGSMVAPGGIICLHDMRPKDMGSYRLFCEIQRAGYVTQELVADPNATEAGVGLVYL